MVGRCRIIPAVYKLGATELDYDRTMTTESIIDPTVRDNARAAMAAYQTELRAAVLELQVRAESPPDLTNSPTPDGDTEDYRGGIAILRVLIEHLDLVDRVMRDVFHSERQVLNLRSAMLRVARAEREFLDASKNK